MPPSCSRLMQHFNNPLHLISYFLLLQWERVPAAIKAQVCRVLEYTECAILESISSEFRNQVQAITATAVDQMIATLYRDSLLNFLHLRSRSRFTDGTSLHPLCAVSQAFHTGTVGQLRTFMSLNNIIFVIPLPFLVDL